MKSLSLNNQVICLKFFDFGIKSRENPDYFLARRDECPESYCRTPGVGVGVGVRVYKNFNLAYNSWTTIDRAFIFHMCIPCDKTFP